MRVLAKGYSEGSTWLYQVLRPEHKLYRELFHQLHSLINKLHGLESEGYWDSQEKVRLDQFIKNVVDMQNAQKQNKLVSCNSSLVSNFLKQDILDGIEKDLKEQGYLSDLGLFAMSEEDAVLKMERMFDLMKERLEPLNLQVKAPIAYVRARLQDGCHNDLQHPSLIVLWHQHKDILKEVTGWQYFFRRFPHKLLVDEDIMYEASAPWQESVSQMITT
eukprot:scaffold292630_cov16-Tisochrysis_lutea.AAC.2